MLNIMRSLMSGRKASGSRLIPLSMVAHSLAMKYTVSNSHIGQETAVVVTSSVVFKSVPMTSEQGEGQYL